MQRIAKCGAKSEKKLLRARVQIRVRYVAALGLFNLTTATLLVLFAVGYADAVIVCLGLLGIRRARLLRLRGISKNDSTVGLWQRLQAGLTFRRRSLAVRFFRT
jgi:uncharacterized membrane protein YciS (DUF1049 family)